MNGTKAGTTISHIYLVQIPDPIVIDLIYIVYHSVLEQEPFTCTQLHQETQQEDIAATTPGLCHSAST